MYFCAISCNVSSLVILSPVFFFSLTLAKDCVFVSLRKKAALSFIDLLSLSLSLFFFLVYFISALIFVIFFLLLTLGFVGFSFSGNWRVKLNCSFHVFLFLKSVTVFVAFYNFWYLVFSFLFDTFRFPF